MLIKGSFTSDEWNHLLGLLNIMNFSTFSRSHFFLSNWKQRAMAKRSQKSTSNEGSPMAKSKPMNLVSHSVLSARKNSPQGMSDSKKRRNTKEEHGNVSTSIWRDMSQHSALNSQVRQQDNTRNVNQGRRSDTSDSTSVSQQLRGEETHMNRPKIDFCSMQISNYEYLGQVFQNLQSKLGTTGDLPQFGDWSSQDECIDVGIVHAINDKSSHPSWAHLHKACGDVQERQIWGNSEFIRYHSEVDMGSSWRDSKCEASRKHRSIMDEIYIVSWSSDQVGESKSDCLFRWCFVLGKISRSFRSKSKMEGQVTEFRLSTSYGELLGIDAEPIEFEWNIFPGFTSWQIVQKIQNDLQERNIEPEQFGDRIIFMSVFNDNNWTMKGNEENCISNSEKVKAHAERFSQGHWTSLDPGSEENGLQDTATNLRENGIPSFPRWCSESKIQSASALSRGILRRLKRKKNKHFNAEFSNTELLFRILHSANHGLVCKVGTKTKRERSEFRRIRTQSERQDVEDCELTRSNLSCTDLGKRHPAFGNKLRERLRDFETLTKTTHSTQVCEKCKAPFEAWEKVCSTKLFQTWKMVLEVSFQHAEGTHSLEQMKEAELLQRFVEEQCSDQSLKHIS